MDQSRIAQLNKSHAHNGSSILYVMSRDQRVSDNHALLAAQAAALEQKLPLVVLFNFYAQSGVRSREHYEFMLAGLAEVGEHLTSLCIPFIIRTGDAVDSITEVIAEIDPSTIYFDFSPLSGPRRIARTIAASADRPVFVVDTHNIIPVWIASDKQEFAAHTMRHKVTRYLAQYLAAPAEVVKHPYVLTRLPASTNLETITSELLPSVAASGITVDAAPGEAAARAHLAHFIDHQLDGYALARNDMAHDQQSGLSPYLHFGHLSSLRVALDVMSQTPADPLLLSQPLMAHAGEAPSREDGMNALFEEMIVRKELADNFCFYAPSYTDFAGANSWAVKTLDDHRADPREFTYTRDQWEQAGTHDPAWNASQNQLRRTGKIHGYMRMYWAKKLLEWSASPEEALATGIYLNDHYSIDGGDPNGYVGLLWSIVGVHDRPWTERTVFGKIRYMNYGGLMRKFDIAKYISDWS